MTGAPDFLCPGAGWLPDSWVLDLGVQRALRLAARDGPRPAAPVRRAARLCAVAAAVLGAPRRARGGWSDPDQIVVTDSARRRSTCLPLSSQPERHGGCRRSLLFQFPVAPAACRAEVVTVADDAGRPGRRGARAPDRRASSAPLSDQRRLAEPNRGDALAGDSPSRAAAGRGPRSSSILEDDTFGDFEAEPSTRLAGLDGLQPGRAGRQRHQGGRRRDPLRLYRRAATTGSRRSSTSSSRRPWATARPAPPCSIGC